MKKAHLICMICTTAVILSGCMSGCTKDNSTDETETSAAISDITEESTDITDVSEQSTDITDISEQSTESTSESDDTTDISDESNSEGDGYPTRSVEVGITVSGSKYIYDNKEISLDELKDTLAAIDANTAVYIYDDNAAFDVYSDLKSYLEENEIEFSEE